MRTAPLALKTCVRRSCAMRLQRLAPKTFPVRFADKFGKLSIGAKARDCTHTHRCFVAGSQAISARAWANCFVLWPRSGFYFVDTLAANGS